MIYIEINKTSKTPLTRQIYFAIRSKILNGILKKNEQLPSSRALAKELCISRNVVLEAYDQLISEGYIITRKGSGTYVSSGAYLRNYHIKKFAEKDSLIGLRCEPDEKIIDFRTGVPDLSLFPLKKWGHLYKTVCASLVSYNLDYHEPRGCYELRYELAKYLRRKRGVMCHPKQIVITTGAAQAFTLTSRLLLDKNQHVVVEDPINKDIFKMLVQSGAAVHAIPVDDKGLVTNRLPTAVAPRLIFTTPSHQFPLGGILPISRRIESLFNT